MHAAIPQVRITSGNALPLSAAKRCTLACINRIFGGQFSKIDLRAPDPLSRLGAPSCIGRPKKGVYLLEDIGGFSVADSQLGFDQKRIAHEGLKNI